MASPILRGWRRRAFCLLVLSIVVPSAGIAAPIETVDLPPSVQEALRRFETFLTEGMQNAEIVGGSVILVHRGELIWEGHIGHADLSTAAPVDRDTIYNWASITKSITALALMQLVERGRIRLDDPAVRYLPELRLVHGEDGWVEAITLRHLLSHTHGYLSPSWPWRDKEEGKEWQPFAPTKWHQLVARFPWAEVIFEPGTKLRYSNAGHIFVARVIEEVSGESFETYVDKNIFKPLEMHRSFFNRAPYHLVGHRSHSYATREGVRRESVFDFDTGIQAANGGWNGPSADMARYLAFLMGATSNPEHSERYEAVLRRTTLEEMWQPHFAFERGYPFEQFGENESTAMALTFFLEENYESTCVAHAGGQEEFSTWFYYDRERDLAYASAFNSNVYERTEEGGEVPKATFFLELAVRDHLLGEVFPLFRKVRTVAPLRATAEYFGTVAASSD